MEFTIPNNLTALSVVGGSNDDELRVPHYSVGGDYSVKSISQCGGRV